MSTIRYLDLFLLLVSKKFIWQEQVTSCFDAPEIRSNTRLGNPGSKHCLYFSCYGTSRAVFSYARNAL